jgi:hypothetical protein
MHRILGTAVLAATLFSAVVPVASAQSADQCAAGQAPHYVFGFAALHDRLGEWMGSAQTCEFADPNATGDVHQRTTNGLAFWRKSTNTPTFTNGSEHWALTSRGFLYWQGSSIDPPANAVAAKPNTNIPAAPPVARPTTPAATSAPQTYSTPNGPRTESQIRSELAAAGYSGPWDLASMFAAYEKATRKFDFAVVDSPGGDASFWCLKANPSCGRDPWWGEWNQIQSERLVQYRFLGPGLVTEERFTEVIWLLWQWPEGKALLKSAADSGVLVVAGPESGAFASFIGRLNAIRVNNRFTETSTWLVADVLAHELKHAADHAATVFDGISFSDCVTREQRAYAVEQRFLYWIWNRFGGFPSGGDVALRLSLEDFELYDNLMTISYSRDIANQAFQDYRGHCSGT